MWDDDLQGDRRARTGSTDPSYATPKARLPHLKEIFARDRGVDHDQDQVRGDGHPEQVRHPVRPDPVDEGDRRGAVAARDRHRGRGRPSEARQVPDASATRSSCPTARPRSSARRCSASTPTKCWPSSATRTDEIAALRAAKVDLSAQRRFGAAITSSTRRSTMATTRRQVRQILDKVKADGPHVAHRARRQARLRRLRHRGAEGRRRDVAPPKRRSSPADMGFPVVMKIVSPDILHKTEAGGVLVGVKSADEVAQGATTRSSPTRRSTTPTRKIVGVQVQQMLAGRPGSDRRRGHRRHRSASWSRSASAACWSRC